MPFYRLLADAPPGKSPLGDVDHERTVLRAIDGWKLTVDWGDGSQATWRTWLCGLGRERTRAACTNAPALTFLWRNDGALRRGIEPVQRALERDFAAMVDELQDLQIVTRDEAKHARPDIRVVLTDERGDQSQRLPDPKTLVAKPLARRSGR